MSKTRPLIDDKKAKIGKSSLFKKTDEGLFVVNLKTGLYYTINGSGEHIWLAIKKGKKRYPFIAFRQGTVFDLPYPNNSFDLVFTSDVLIHVSPKHLAKALGEIIRVSRRFVLGFEFYADKPQAVVYRGHRDLLWRRNYKQEYLKPFPSLSVIYEKKLNHSEKVVGARGLKSELFVLKMN